jgi:hypothetical protein
MRKLTNLIVTTRRDVEQRRISAVPTGLLIKLVKSLFPALKRGANNPCAYGADYGRLPALQMAME